MDDEKSLGASLARMSNQIATDNVQLYSVIDLLIDKGIITKEEVNEKFEVFFEKESDKIHDYIQDGKLDN